MVDKLEKDVSSRKTSTGKVIEGLRLRSVLDPIGWNGDPSDDYDDFSRNSENKSSAEKGISVTTMTAPDEKLFSLEISPQPPTVDRPVPQIIKVDDFVEYQTADDGCLKTIDFWRHGLRMQDTVDAVPNHQAKRLRF